MIQLHIGSQTLVFPLQEVFGAPDADGAVVSTGRQVLPITAEIKARHIPTVALKGTHKHTQAQRVALDKEPKVMCGLFFLKMRIFKNRSEKHSVASLLSPSR